MNPNLSSSPLAVFGIALFAVIGLVGSGPMASLVDCNDAFWAVACGDSPGADLSIPNETIAAVPAAARDNTPAPAQRIDNDPQCTTLENGNLLCSS